VPVVSGILCTVLVLYSFVILIRIILSWIPASPGGALEVVFNIFFVLTEPVLGPLRSILPPVRLGAMALDLSPIVVFIAIRILMAFVC
jgi:YggT family protein